MSNSPYTSPQARIQEPIEDQTMDQMEYKELRKLYLRSRNLRAMAIIWFFYGLILTLAPILAFQDDRLLDPEIGPILNWVILVLGVFFLVVVWGLVTRPHWGRLAGIISSALSILSINLFGILLGAFGMFATLGSPRLFGENRFRHGDLKRAMKEKKRQRRS